MDEQQTAQLKDLELRWDAMKKLTEHASVLDKQISEMQLAEVRCFCFVFCIVLIDLV